MSRLAALLAVLVVPALPAASAASAAPALPAVPAAPLPAQDTLSFDDAVRLAREHNPSLQQARHAVDAEGQLARQSLSGLLPAVNASVSFSGGEQRSLTGEDDFGLPTVGEQFRESTQSSSFQSLSGTVSLFDLAAIRRLGASRAGVDVREAALEARAVRLRSEVGRAYFGAVRAQRQIELEERLLATARSQRDAVERLLRVAARQPSDLLGAEVDVAGREQGVQQARNEARKAGLALREALGLSGEEPVVLADDFPAVFDPSALDADALVARAASSSPQMEERLAAVEAADRRAGVASAAWFPVLQLEGGITRTSNLRGYDALFDFDPPNRNLRFGLSARLPIFDGLHREASIAEARIRTREERERLREARLVAERGVRSALIDLENAYGSLRLAERRVELSRRRLELAREEYRLDIVSFTELQQIIDQAADAERTLLEARLDFTRARFDLEERVGEPVR